MEEDWKPFEVRETWEGTTLYLHGTRESRLKVEADKVAKILEAIRRDWNVDIRYAIIDGDIDIRDIELERDESGRLVIAGEIEITNSDINGEASFVGASFNRSASFVGASFNGSALFGGASFNRLAFFVGASFNGLALFGGASFTRGASFDGASFNGEASFAEASFKDDPEIRGAGHDKLSPDSFAGIGLAYRKSVLSGASFFFEKAGHGYWASGDLLEASEAFRDAKVEYEKEGKYDEAGNMYVWEKDSTRRQLRLQRGQRLKWIWFWIWKHVSNYGEAPLRFIGVAAIIIAVFAVLYMPIISSIPVVSDWFSWWPSITFEKYPFHDWSNGFINGYVYNFMTAFYFSAVTFATLGFGDIAPVSIVGKFLTVVQVLLGYVMFGILITLVARKMTRS